MKTQLDLILRQTSAGFGSFRDFLNDRRLGRNREQNEAFACEMYALTFQLVIVNQNELSDTAKESFPVLSAPDLQGIFQYEIWMCDFALWLITLSAADVCQFINARFAW
jgi:hypothetical protein